MFEKGALLFLYTLTPLHVGTGQGLGFIDLPLQRERITGFPMIQASEIKGKLRSLAVAGYEKDQEQNKTDEKQKKIRVVFGPEKESASEHAGSLSVSDARVLLFPVRSLKGVFAWVTCEEVLTRFWRDLQLAGVQDEQNELSSLDFRLDATETAVAEGSILELNGNVVLEEYTFNVKMKAREQVKKLACSIKNKFPPKDSLHKYFRDTLECRLAVIPNDCFRYFAQFATEVVTRVALDSETKTVAGQALWNEEYLPSETLLYSVCLVSKPRAPSLPADWEQNTTDRILEFVNELAHNKCIQLGGDETVGKGMVASFIYQDQPKAGGDKHG